MGATSIHYTIEKTEGLSAQQAYKELVQEALQRYDDDPYSGTIATCSLRGKVNAPEDDEAYMDLLDEISKREVYYYEADGLYHFFGWAAC